MLKPIGNSSFRCNTSQHRTTMVPSVCLMDLQRTEQWTYPVLSQDLYGASCFKYQDRMASTDTMSFTFHENHWMKVNDVHDRTRKDKEQINTVPKKQGYFGTLWMINFCQAISPRTLCNLKNLICLRPHGYNCTHWKPLLLFMD
jgi:hypothetical protein